MFENKTFLLKLLYPHPIIAAGKFICCGATFNMK